MKKCTLGLLFLVALVFLSACSKGDPIDDDPIDENIYQLLVDAENLSGMADKTRTVIRESGSLDWPFEFQGVQITYSSRDKSIIDDTGQVFQPDSCWIESRDQQGNPDPRFDNLNDNWPVVVDVVLSYRGQTRSAKLLFVVAPQEGFTCDKYMG